MLNSLSRQTGPNKVNGNLKLDELPTMKHEEGLNEQVQVEELDKIKASRFVDDDVDETEYPGDQPIGKKGLI